MVDISPICVLLGRPSRQGIYKDLVQLVSKMMHLLAASNFESAVLQRLSCTTLNEIARFLDGEGLGRFPQWD